MRGMNTCETCKWWRPPDEFEIRNGRVQGYCGHEKFDDDNAEDGVYGGENGCLVHTGPDFGCIHHEGIK